MGLDARRQDLLYNWTAVRCCLGWFGGGELLSKSIAVDFCSRPGWQVVAIVVSSTGNDGAACC